MTQDNHDMESEPHDDIAMDGMLRELAEGEGAQPNMAYVERVMKAVRSAPAETKADTQPPEQRKNLWWPIAAVLVLAGTAVFFWLQPGHIGTVMGDSLAVLRNGKIRELKYEDRLYAGDVITTSNKEIISLSEGSELTLGAGTKLALMKPGATERVRLSLESGRIFLRVTKGKGRFIVDAGGPVEVLGTAFGVARKDSGARVGVYEGRVAVGSDASRVEITRGESAAIDSRGYGSVISADVNQELAWARETATFNQQPLGEFIDWVEANSAYRFKVSAKLRNSIKAFGGVQTTDDIRKVLAYIVTTNNLKCQINGNDIVLSR